jgi:hypothetical protein
MLEEDSRLIERERLASLDQIRQFLEGTEAISFQIESKDARYRWIQHALVKFR